MIHQRSSYSTFWATTNPESSSTLRSRTRVSWKTAMTKFSQLTELTITNLAIQVLTSSSWVKMKWSSCQMTLWGARSWRRIRSPLPSRNMNSSLNSWWTCSQSTRVRHLRIRSFKEHKKHCSNSRMTQTSRMIVSYFRLRRRPTTWRNFSWTATTNRTQDSSRGWLMPVTRGSNLLSTSSPAALALQAISLSPTWSQSSCLSLMKKIKSRKQKLRAEVTFHSNSTTTST